MHLNPPPAGVIAEIPNHHLGCLEGAIAIIERHPYPGITKADNVRSPVARSEEYSAGKHVNPPPAGVIAEIPNHHLGCLEGAIAIIERHPYPGITKADNVRSPVACQVA